MKKLIMFFMALMLCLGFAGEAEADPVCLVVCPTDAGDGDEVTVTAYDENDEWYDFRSQDGVELCFGDAGCVWSGGEGDESLDVSSGDGVFTITQDMLDSDIFDFWCWPDEVWFTLANPEVPESFDTVAEAVAAGGSCEGRGCGPPSPFVIDPNVMLVYEEGETVGDFGISMKNALPTGKTATVTIDPNLAAEDITLLGGDPCEGGTITLTFNDSNWDVPQTVVFKAIDDDIAEPPELEEQQSIVVTSVYSETLQDPNWAGEKVVKVNVMDNDQANILFRVTPPRGGARVPVTGPVQLWEEEAPAGIKWRKIGIQLQVQPSGDPVKLNAEVTGEIEGDNLPPTDPCLPLQEAADPNCFTFTSTTSTNGLGTGCVDHDPANKTTCWNVDQDIKIWGNDDDVLQVEAFAEGDQNYQAVLEVTVIDDGGDERYADLAEDDPKTVQFDIEDNECGAFGISYLDIGNPNAATDPNYRDDDDNPLPDCHIDIYDVIEFATKWLDCSDPQDPGCESYL